MTTFTGFHPRALEVKCDGLRSSSLSLPEKEGADSALTRICASRGPIIAMADRASWQSTEGERERK